AQFWMTPSRAHTTRTAALTAFASAVKLEVDGSFAKALPILTGPLLRDHVLNEYVLYYKGLAELSANRPSDAPRTFQSVAGRQPGARPPPEPSAARTRDDTIPAGTGSRRAAVFRQTIRPGAHRLRSAQAGCEGRRSRTRQPAPRGIGLFPEAAARRA